MRHASLPGQQALRRAAELATMNFMPAGVQYVPDRVEHAPRAGLYARVSSDLQSAASIEDKLRVCAEWATTQGLQVVGSYTDQGISGATLIRPGIQELLQDAADGKFDILLTESLDRLPRDNGEPVRGERRINP